MEQLRSQSAPYGPDISELKSGFYRILIPIPSPLRHVNAYVVRGPEGWTVVDTGFHTPEAEAAWLAAFQRIGLEPAHVTHIVVTHYHPDHFGCAGWLQGLTGAPVTMHGPEIQVVERVWSPDFPVALDGFLALHGTPGPIRARLTAAARRIYEQVLPKPRISPVTQDDPVTIGGDVYRVVPCPGHTDSLMVLMNYENGVMVASDMLLAPITPNISCGPQTAAADPLGNYLASLEKVARLPARLALTGHRDTIEDVPTRAAEIRDHHGERLDHLEELVRRHGPAPAWELAHHLFGRVMNTDANVNFALGETVAHLEHLVHRKRLAFSRDDEGVAVYCPLGNR